MLNWVYKQWIFQPIRAFLVMVVFASVLSLAMLFDGILLGIDKDMREFPQSISADLIAINSGNLYFAMGPSSLPNSLLGDLWFEPDIADAQPLALFPFILSHANQKTPAMLVAYAEAGRPTKLISGKEPELASEIVIDNSLARLHLLEVGDEIEILGRDLSISGISSGTTSPFMPYVFVAYDPFINEVRKMMMSVAEPEANQAELPASMPVVSASMPVVSANTSIVSVVLIDVDDNADIEKVRNNLEDTFPVADFKTPFELGEGDANFATRMLGPVLILLSAMAWLITLLTMTILRQAEVQSNLHQFGIQKALGAKPFGLAVALIFGGVLIALSSFPLALLLAKGLAWLMAEWNPLYNARVWELSVLVRALVVSLTAVVAGMCFPWRQLVKLAPVIVFKR